MQTILKFNHSIFLITIISYVENRENRWYNHEWTIQGHRQTLSTRHRTKTKQTKNKQQNNHNTETKNDEQHVPYPNNGVDPGVRHVPYPNNGVDPGVRHVPYPNNGVDPGAREGNL